MHDKKTPIISKSKKKIGVFIAIIIFLIIALLVYFMVAPSKEQRAQSDYIAISESKNYVTSESFDTKTSNDESATMEDIMTISITEYRRTFEDNSLAADKNFRNKMFEVTGKVNAIAESDDAIYVTLTEDSGWIICGFELDYLDEILEIKTGDIVTIRGRSRGSLNFEVGDDLGKCAFVSTNAANQIGKTSDTGDNYGFYVVNFLDMTFTQIYDLIPQAFEGKVTFEEIPNSVEDGMSELTLWVYVDGVPVIVFTTYNTDGTDDERYVSHIVVLNPNVGIPLNDDLKSDMTVEDIERLAATTDLQIDINKPEDDFMTYAYISYGMNEYAMRFSYTYHSYAMEVELFTGQF